STPLPTSTGRHGTTASAVASASPPRDGRLHDRLVGQSARSQPALPRRRPEPCRPCRRDRPGPGLPELLTSPPSGRPVRLPGGDRVFVCTGNICRSPMAAAFLAARLGGPAAGVT